MAVTSLTSAAEVLVATAHDPYVRGRLTRPDIEGWSDGDATAWRFSDGYLMTHGEPPAVALLIEKLLPELRNGIPLTVPRGTAPLLPAWVAMADGTNWDFRWIAVPPPAQTGEDDVVVVTGDEVQPLLAEAHPTASAQPGDARVRRWWGIRGPDGLIACAADTSEATGVGHLSSIATHPAARGRGLGAAITAAASRQLLDEDFDVVTLGMYASNVAGRALYDRLGMAERLMTSGELQIRSRW